MAQIIHERTIDGKLVKVSQFPAGRGWRIFMKLTRGVLPAFTGLVGAVKNWKELDIDGNGLQAAAEKLCLELEPEKSEALIKELLSLTFIDGQECSNEGVFDSVFQGNYGLMIKAVAFSIEANYKSFLPEGGLKSLIDRLPEAKRPSEFQTH